MMVHKERKKIKKYVVGQGFSDILRFIDNNKEGISNIAKLTGNVADAGIKTAQLVNEIKKIKKGNGYKDKVQEINKVFGSGFKIIQ